MSLEKKRIQTKSQERWDFPWWRWGWPQRFTLLPSKKQKSRKRHSAAASAVAGPAASVLPCRKKSSHPPCKLQ
ncbi:hypothetical protein Ancab_004385, partial [Ancistrocladus abbreviatus]